MPCLNHCYQGRRPCPTPLQCAPRRGALFQYVVGTLVACLFITLALVLLALSLK